jgi:hypothetical protein
MKILSCWGFGFFLLCSACSGGGGGNDGGTDASTNADSSANDATSDSQASLDASNDAGNDASAALIAQCQTQAQHFATLCAASAPRPCLWNAYAQLCATGQTQLLIDSMNCLDQNTCRTFSDANNGVSCLDTLHSTDESQASRQFIIDSCNACTDAGGCAASYGTAEIFPYLTDADIALLTSSNCRGTACTIDSAVQACASTVPDVNLFLACTQ